MRRSTQRRSVIIILYIALFIAPLPTFTATTASAQGWVHLSTEQGNLPEPSNSTQQTASLVLDIDRDGVNDFVIGIRQGTGPSLVWYRRTENGWDRYVIDKSVLNIEAGGTFYDIDDDGDLDIVMGGDSADNKVWWWENPYPNFDPSSGWTRRLIKNSGQSKHHDQLFADVDNDSAVELIFWNQNAQALVMADIPANPRTTEPWPQTTIYTWNGGNEHEGLTTADIDGDGLLDIVGGGRWFKYNGGTDFTANVIDDAMRFTRAAAGQLIQGGRPEVVFVCGDCNGPLRLYEWNGSAWIGRNLLGNNVDHGHSLAVDDLNGDGHLDIFVAEMRLNGGNSNAHMWLLAGDSNGNFTQTEIANGYGNHESKVADLDGDGDLDILGKPYNWQTPRLDIWLNGGTGAPCRQSLADWQRHVIDSNRPWRAIFVDSADLNSDGLADVVSGGWWYENPGDPEGNWNRNPIGAPLNNMAALYDFDGDGDIDILGTQGQGSTSNAAFAWARNDGQGNFTVLTNISSGEGDFLQGVSVGQFVPNGATEVALSWHESNNGVQMLTVPANPAGTQWSWRTIAAAAQDEALSVGDIDRDGDRDLLQGTAWLRNGWSAGDSSGPWAQVGLAGGTSPDRNQLVDMNQDGRLDAVVGFEAVSKAGKLAWYEQGANATANWTEHIIDTTVIGPMSLDVRDMDHDGDWDVIVGEHNLANPNNARMLIYENSDGNGLQWTQHVVYTGDEHHDGAHVVDIDNDGDLDIISIGWGHARVVLYENLAGPCDGATPTPVPTSTPAPSSTPAPTNTPAPTSTPASTNDSTTATPSPTATVTATSVDSCVDDGTNLVQNGGFETGELDWKFYTNGSGSFSVVGTAYECAAAAQLQFNRVGNNMQLYQAGIALKANTRYRLSFAAYSTSGHDLGVYLQKHTASYGSYGLSENTVDLSTTWQLFNIEFTTSGFSGSVNDGRLRFWFVGKAAAGDRYFIDGIKLTEATATTSTPVPTATSTSTPTPTSLPATATATAAATSTTSAPTDTATSTSQPTATQTNTPTAPAPSTATMTPTSTPTATVVTSSCTDGESNLVRNGGFENGNDDWNFYTNAGGNLTVTSAAFRCTGAAQLQFNGTGNNMQLYQTDIALEPNTRYRLSFAAYATSGRNMQLYLHKHTANYTNYGLDVDNVDLTTSWQTYSYEFTSSGFGSPVRDGRLRFWFVGDAAAGDRYFIDAIKLTEATGATPTLVPTATATPTLVATATQEPTATGTSVPTATATATAQSAATSTVTPTATTTSTAIPTPTPSATPVTGDCVDDGINFVSNGGFEAGDSDWRFYTNGSGTLNTTSSTVECASAAQLQFNSTGNNMQLYQSDITLEPNTRYRLSFAAYSTSGRDMGVYLHKHTANYGSYGLDISTVDLATSWQTFEFEFVTSGFGSRINDGRLRFWFVGEAAAGDRYFIDAIQLIPLDVNVDMNAAAVEQHVVFLPLLHNE